MPTRKIDPGKYSTGWYVEQCNHPDHDPAKMIVREPGFYQHDCPGCGLAQFFRVEPGTRLG